MPVFIATSLGLSGWNVPIAVHCQSPQLARPISLLFESYGLVSGPFSLQGFALTGSL